MARTNTHELDAHILLCRWQKLSPHLSPSPAPSLLTFHSSSSLLIWVAEIWRARACSLSPGTFTSQFWKLRSLMRDCHWVGFLRGGRKGGREEGREGGREGGRKGGREGEREGGWEWSGVEGVEWKYIVRTPRDLFAKERSTQLVT